MKRRGFFGTLMGLALSPLVFLAPRAVHPKMVGPTTVRKHFFYPKGKTGRFGIDYWVAKPKPKPKPTDAEIIALLNQRHKEAQKAIYETLEQMWWGG